MVTRMRAKWKHLSCSKSTVKRVVFKIVLVKKCFYSILHNLLFRADRNTESDRAVIFAAFIIKLINDFIQGDHGNRFFYLNKIFF